MTLRSFHLVFVTVCLCLFGFLLAWSVLWTEPSRMQDFAKISGIVGLLATPIYAWYFLRKSKNLMNI